MHAPEDALGRTVAGRYRLDKVLGEGGFGAVYVATRDDGTQVALKVLADHALERVGGDDRFHREAELARRLDHPNVVKVLDEGIDDEGIRFIAFELLRGRSLADEIGRWGAMQPRRAASIALAVLAALEAAHAVGIVHRDLKPANIFLLDGSDSLKVLDFGIAKSINKDTIAGLTHAGQVLGTPAYMAVEQLTGDPVTPATDLFALGIVLVEMLLGKPPYPSGSTAMDIVRSRLTGLHLDLPGDVARSPLGEIVRRASMPHPRERYQAASEMRAALEAALLSPALGNTAVSVGQQAGASSYVPTQAGAPVTAMGSAPAHTPQAWGHTAVPTGGMPPPVFGPPAARAAPGATGGIVMVAAAVAALAIGGLGVGLWMSASRQAVASAEDEDAEDEDEEDEEDEEGDEEDEEGDEEDEEDEEPRKGKRRNKRNKQRSAPRQDPAPGGTSEDTVVPPVPVPVAPEPPAPAAHATRVLECRGAGRETSASLTRHVTALGWRVTGQLQLCAGSMVNFRCIGGGGKGITMESGAQSGSTAVVKFPSAAAASTHADEQRGKTSDSAITWAKDGAALLYIEMPESDADRLMARICPP